MNDTWGTPETQPPQTTPEMPEPVRFHTAHGWLILGAVSIAVAIVGALVDHLTAVTVGRGVFAILAAVSVGGFSAWTVQSAEVRNRRGLSILLGAMCQRQREGAARQREMLDKLEELTVVVERLERQCQPQRTVPVPTCRSSNTYVSSNGGQEDTVPLTPTVDRAGDGEREAAIEDAFELGYRARQAEEKATRLPGQKRATHG